MQIPFTKYGWPQVVVYPAITLAAMIILALFTTIGLPLWLIIVLEFVLALILIWSLSFFRDPYRKTPSDENILFSPADGKITEIEIVEGNEFIGSPAIKIGIFLSIFNVHINRAPSNVKVGNIIYKKGQYKNAMNPESGRVNESNELQLVRTSNPADKLIIRQISGTIARRIVCKTNKGKELAAGEKFGMIKFGSRTELYVSVSGISKDKKNNVEKSDSGSEDMMLNSTINKEYNIKCLVKSGDKVKAGLTPLLRYEKR